MVLFRPALALSFLLGALAPVQAVTVKIMPLGDSLTAGPGCWRALVWQKLQNESVTNTDFVGSQTSSCAFPFDGEHEGHGGYSAMSIVRDNQLPAWLASATPDMVTVMLGTNDAFSTLPALTVLAAFDTLVDQMRASKSTMRILIAQIPPLNPSGCTAPCYTLQAVIDFNNALAAWAPGKSTTASPITIVDCWTGFIQPDDFVDGVHPSDSGTQKLANCWYGPMKAAILGFGSSPTTSSSASRTTTTSVRTTSSTQRTSSSTTSSSRTMTTTSSAQKSSSSTTSSSRTTTTSAGGVALWGQCGGLGWTGLTSCASGTCTIVNTWFSQCLL